jgi:hypothetical protein
MATAFSPYPPEVDAHIWRGYRPVKGQLKIGIALPDVRRAPLWAAQVLNLLVAETAVKLDVVYRFDGFPRAKWFHRFAHKSFREVTIAARPACCFIDVEYEPDSGLTDEARSTIAERSLDVLLWLDTAPLLGRANALARLGVWSFSFEGAALALRRFEEDFSSSATLGTYEAAAPSDALSEMAGPLLIRAFLDELSREGQATSPGFAAPNTNAKPVFRDGSWYLQVNAGEPNPEIFLFHGDSAEGPWHYHPANPVCSIAAQAANYGFVPD